MRFSRIRLALCAAMIAVAGCGDGPNAVGVSPIGDYLLTSVNGGPLPAVVIAEPGLNVQVTDGWLTLNPNNTFVESITLATIVDNGQPELGGASCIGSYRWIGNTVTLTTPATDICIGQLVNGTLSKNTLTIRYEGDVFVFTRQ